MVNAHGYSRTTLDLDFLAREAQRKAWTDLLTGWGYRLFHERKGFSQFESPSKDEFDVDAMFVDDGTFAKLKEARKFRPVGSTILPVAGVLHLIALKLHATRTWERPDLPESCLARGSFSGAPDCAMVADQNNSLF